MGRWRHGQRRLILLDWEGALYLDDPLLSPSITSADRLSADPSSQPDSFKAAIDVLRKLSDNRKNEVWLLSDLPVKGALSQIAVEVPKIGIV